MSMLDKILNLTKELDESPDKLADFMVGYEQFRNEIVYNELKNDDSIYIAQEEFYILSDTSTKSNLKRVEGTFGNKKHADKFQNIGKIPTFFSTDDYYPLAS
ncbi:hypothetical protein [Enterococcus casseliflavus]|uniref:hypothetical protein n=1 Tax=Enterococcus casseliflavus TaxID=37734 RepID=UPI001CA912B6|nr:hypothetical protein [Enterococcus casseliflavus]MBZ0323605.1 hypothetical protein [Enterococcus casseliflavus]